MDWLAVAVTSVVSVGSAGLALWAGRRVGFVDQPDGEMKPHSGSPVPLGGLAIFAGLHVGLAMAGLLTVGLSVGLSIALVVGLIDDVRGLLPGVRLVASTIAGLATATAVTNDALLVVVVTALVVVTWNAVNLLDGMDALAGGVTAITGVGVAILGLGSTSWAGALLAAAVLGFLVWNLPPARMFLGDNGAYVVGVALAWVAVAPANTWIGGLLGVALIGLPLIDLGSTVLRRLMEGRPLLSGDRDHTYDRLRGRGVSVAGVAATFAVAQASWIATLIVVAEVVGESGAVVAAIVAAVAAVVVITVTGREPRDLKSA